MRRATELLTDPTLFAKCKRCGHIAAWHHGHYVPVTGKQGRAAYCSRCTDPKVRHHEYEEPAE